MIAFARIGAAQSWPSDITSHILGNFPCPQTFCWSALKGIMHDYVTGIAKFVQLPFGLVVA